MPDAVVVRGIEAQGRHGLESAGERESLQPFVVDVELRTDIVLAAAADRLEKTIDYVDVVRAVRRVIETESFELIETLAETIAARLLVMGAEGVRVRVSKPQVAASMRVDEVAVVVERSAV